MSQRFEHYFLIVQRKNGVISKLHFFERVHVETTDAVRVRQALHSKAFTLSLVAHGLLSVGPLEGQGIFSWFEEKYAYTNTSDLYDQACSLGLPPAILDWFTTRL